MRFVDDTLVKAPDKAALFPHEIEKRALPLFNPRGRSRRGGMTPIVTGLTREGVAFLKDDVESFVLDGWRYPFGATAMEAKENLSEAINEAEDAQKRLRAMMLDFRSKTKNDLDSMGALGKQIRNEMGRIQEAMNTTIHLMTSAPMLEAIENAARLAAALDSIDKLSSTRVSFAIIDMPPAGAEKKSV